MTSAMTFTCDTCGQEHEVADISFGTHEPDQWWTVTEKERANSELGAEQCVINTAGERSYYIRAVLPIPVRGEGDAAFEWGVWCSLSETSFREISDHWDDPERVKFGPHFGWL